MAITRPLTHCLKGMFASAAANNSAKSCIAAYCRRVQSQLEAKLGAFAKESDRSALELRESSLHSAILQIHHCAEAVVLQFEDVIRVVEWLLYQSEPHRANSW
jgi:hypothetical protein